MTRSGKGRSRRRQGAVEHGVYAWPPGVSKMWVHSMRLYYPGIPRRDHRFASCDASRRDSVSMLGSVLLVYVRVSSRGSFREYVTGSHTRSARGTGECRLASPCGTFAAFRHTPSLRVPQNPRGHICLLRRPFLALLPSLRLFWARL